MSKKEFRKRSEIFLKDLNSDYFDLTHLHGFKELSLSSYKVEKIFWIFIIVAAFAFTGFLIFKSVEDSLEDKKQTFINYERYGNISLPILYCPTNWIDLNKMNQTNISQRYVMYALSYLRTLSYTYMDETLFSYEYDVTITPSEFCGHIVSSEQELPILIYLAPFIESKCLWGDVPDYYGELSIKLIELLGKVTKVVDMTNPFLMKKIFDACMNNSYDEIWAILYYQFPLSLSTRYEMIQNLGLEGISKKIAKCEKSKFAIFMTLQDVDNLNNQTAFGCSSFMQNFKSSNDSTIFESKTNWCSIYNDATAFYMFHSEAFVSYLCTGCKVLSEFENRRSERISKIISTNAIYSNYLMKNNLNASFETFKTYLNDYIGGSFLNQNSELNKIRKSAEQQFQTNEKNDFYKYLDEKNWTIFDLFKTVSFDENKFLLGMSVDPYDEIRPRSGTISIEKVINAYGVCYLFEIVADTKPVTQLPINIMNDVNRRRKLNEKLYVNIIDLYTGYYMQVRSRDNNVLVVGREAKNLIPSQHSYEIKTKPDWREHYYSFEVSNLAYESRREFTKCQENIKNANNFTYTFSNCLANCFNRYSQPKYIHGRHKMSNCQYIAESMFDNDISEYCSYFSAFSNNRSSDIVSVQKDLDLCNANCLKDCDLTTFDVISSVVDCFSSADNVCPVTRRGPNIEKYQDEKTLLSNYYLNLPVNGSQSGPIWMKSYQYGDAKFPTITDLISGIATVYAPAIARIEIQINSDITTYMTSQSLEWYSYLGVVGGQVNLIVSGSLLTVFQILWWCSRHCYRHSRISKQHTIRRAKLQTIKERNFFVMHM